jgi:hypothetical protein
MEGKDPVVWWRGVDPRQFAQFITVVTRGTIIRTDGETVCFAELMCIAIESCFSTQEVSSPPICDLHITANHQTPSIDHDTP